MATKSKVYIGRYVVNACPITVDGIEGSEGSGMTGWFPNAYCRITIGLDAAWPKVQEVAFHEIMEYTMLIHGCGLTPFRFLKRVDCEMYRYQMTHEQFTEVIQAMAHVMQYLLPELSKAHRKWHRKK